jgi:S-adenosylmethionine synthetase
MKHFFTSESVSEGHPDKIADQISDAILDDILSQDKDARVACETMVTTGQVIVAGEIRTSGYCNVNKVVRKVIADIGYNDPKIGFDASSCGILSYLHEQSSDIAQGVDEGGEKEQGAGDQGLMFGFAIDETPECMPLAVNLSHQILQRLSQARKTNEIDYLRPDSKSQVTVEYAGDTPLRVDAIVLSTQHTEEADLDSIRKDMVEQIIKPTIGSSLIDDQTKFFINPTGRFVIGGPHGDCGLTGRKIIVDTYGGMGRHGGGCFSGKDPSKVDRSAAYAARYIAKNIVAAGLAKKCEVQLAYAIGIAEPVSIFVDTFGTGTIADDKISAAVSEIFPTKPKDIITELNLLNTLYLPTATYGHFGKAGMPWEQTDKIEELHSKLS